MGDIITDVWRCGPPRATGRKQGFPERFWRYFKREYVGPTDKLLHLCSGDQTDGVTVDIDPAAKPEVLADARRLPFPNSYFDVVFADPPYSVGYAGEWPAEYPRPAHLLREMYRVVRPGGLVTFFHLLVAPAPRGLGGKLIRVAIHAILCGPNNVMRALNIFRRTLI